MSPALLLFLPRALLLQHVIDKAQLNQFCICSTFPPEVLESKTYSLRFLLHPCSGDREVGFLMGSFLTPPSVGSERLTEGKMKSGALIFQMDVNHCITM